MTNIRLPMAVCAVVAEVLEGSHQRRDALFESAGVPGPPPDLPHHSKWKTWLLRAGNDPSVDSLAVLGRLIEEFMDLPPLPTLPTELSFGIGHDPVAEYNNKRTRLIAVLEQLLFFTLNREDFSFVIHLDRQPRTSRRREAQTGSRARSGSRSERTLDAVEHSRTLMEWWPFLIFHRGGLRIKVINNSSTASAISVEDALSRMP